MSEETLICLTMHAFKCDKETAEKIISSARQGDCLQDLAEYVSIKPYVR